MKFARKSKYSYDMRIFLPQFTIKIREAQNIWHNVILAQQFCQFFAQHNNAEKCESSIYCTRTCVHTDEEFSWCDIRHVMRMHSSGTKGRNITTASIQHPCAQHSTLILLGTYYEFVHRVNCTTSIHLTTSTNKQLLLLLLFISKKYRWWLLRVSSTTHKVN